MRELPPAGATSLHVRDECGVLSRLMFCNVLRFCYTEKVTAVLEKHLASLMMLYETYAEVSNQLGDNFRDKAALSVGEWLTFLQHVGLLQSKMVSLHDAKMIFLWSRIRSVEQSSARSASPPADGSPGGSGMVVLGARAEGRLRHLSLYDFIEAIVRLATYVPLPTDSELEELNAADAGELLLAMQAKAPTVFAKFLQSHRPQHKDPDGSDWEKHAAQPIWRCVDHLIRLIVRTVEHNTSAVSSTHDGATVDGEVQKSEASKFVKTRSSGRELLHMAPSKMSEALVDVDFEEKLEAAKAKSIMAVAVIKIQMMVRIRRARARVAERKARQLAGTSN